MAWAKMRGHEGHNGVAQGLGLGGCKGGPVGTGHSVSIGAMRNVMCMTHQVVERGSWESWVPGCMLVSSQQGAHQRDGRGQCQMHKGKGGPWGTVHVGAAQEGTLKGPWVQM